MPQFTVVDLREALRDQKKRVNPAIFSTPTTVAPSAGSIVVTGHAPTVTAGATVAPAAGSVVITGFAPTVTYGVTVAPPTGRIVITGFAPTVTNGGNVPTATVPTTGSDATTYRNQELNRQARRRRKLRAQQAERLREELAAVEAEAAEIADAAPEAETIRATARRIAAEIRISPELPPVLEIFARQEFQRHFPAESPLPAPNETEEYKSLSRIVARLRQGMLRAAAAARIERERTAAVARATAEWEAARAEDEDDVAMLLMAL